LGTARGWAGVCVSTAEEGSERLKFINYNFVDISEWQLSQRYLNLPNGFSGLTVEVVTLATMY
jgi:hypothetical protein